MTRADAKAYWMGRIQANVRLRIIPEIGELVQTPYLVDHDFHLIDWSVVAHPIIPAAMLQAGLTPADRVYLAGERLRRDRRAAEAFERAAREIKAAFFKALVQNS